MNADTPRSRAHPVSGTDAPSGAAIPTGTTAEPNSETPTHPGTSPSAPSLPLPGLPFSVDPKRLLWYGGLAALATVGVLEWPVAAVVGVGSYVTERMARDDAVRAARQHS
ncbi:MAG: hypothetical protein JO037_16900 [Actinobacteria bacterium]|nr:hypothetical protein [Actinomycetota bacterium]